jgi:prepilin-type N-terminal cleavage/methylation domain-containing protein
LAEAVSLRVKGLGGRRLQELQRARPLAAAESADSDGRALVSRPILGLNPRTPTDRDAGAAFAIDPARRSNMAIATWSPRFFGEHPTLKAEAGIPRGFTLLETLVALGLSATLLGTLFPVYWHVTRGALLAHEHSVGTMLAAQRLEQLRALAFRFDAGAVGPERVTDVATDLSGATATQGGAGLAPSPAAALLVPTPGYVDYLDAQGRWVGSGVSPPAEAAFVRRWAVTPSLAAPEDGLLLQVLVSALGAERRDGPRTDATRRPGDVWLTLFRSRVM